MRPIEKELTNIVNQCERCGACLPVCPLYAITGREISVARGKNAAIRAMLGNGAAVNAELQEALDFCLLCKACTTACPNKVSTDEAMELAREKVAQTLGNSLSHKLTGKVMQYPLIVNMASKVLSLCKATKLDCIVGKVLPIGSCSKKYQSMFVGPQALSGIKSFSKNENSKFEKVAYFKGCAMKMFFPEAAESTISVLGKVSAVSVPDSVCCGMPHMAHGMGEIADKLAKETINTFEGYDAIITDCGSCGSALKSYAARFAGDEKWQNRAKKFSSKVMGFTEYLSVVGYEPKLKQEITVTYHDSCHLSRGQGIKNQPRELLKKAANFIELPEASVCCGGAGTFQVDFPEISDKILAAKIKNINSTKAALVAAECPACMLQLAKGEGKNEFQVVHISQILANS